MRRFLGLHALTHPGGNLELGGTSTPSDIYRWIHKVSLTHNSTDRRSTHRLTELQTEMDTGDANGLNRREQEEIKAEGL